MTLSPTDWDHLRRLMRDGLTLPGDQQRAYDLQEKIAHMEGQLAYHERAQAARLDDLAHPSANYRIDEARAILDRIGSPEANEMRRLDAVEGIR